MSDTRMVADLERFFRADRRNGQDGAEKISRAMVRAFRRAGVTADVDVYDYCGEQEVVSGLVVGAGDPESEIRAIAHTGDRGAPANASGRAVCVEIARVLEALIADGRLPRPRRTIRFLCGPRTYGAAAFLSRQSRWQPQFAGVCIDSIGLWPDSPDQQPRWSRTAPVSAGFVDDVGEIALRAALRAVSPGCRLEIGDADATEMTLLADPKYGFPCPRLSAVPEYKSAGDVDGKGLTACAVAMAVYLTFLADAGTREALALARWQTARSLVDLAGSANPGEAAWICLRHKENMKRLRHWLWEGSHEKTESVFLDLEQQVAEAAGMPPHGRATAPNRRAAKQPRRIRRKRVTYIPESLEPGIRKELLAIGVPPWSLYWADGERTTRDIAVLIRAATGERVSYARVDQFFRLLERLGYADLGWPGRPVEKQELIAGLGELGVRKGMDLIVHCALPPLGHVVGGGDTVIDALLEAVGPRGTVVLPSFTHGHADVFNPLVTPTKDGAIADLFWRRVEAVRSEHPTHATAAIGPKSGRWSRGHVQNGIWGEGSALVRLIREGGYILLLGVDWNEVSARHAVHALVGTCTDMFAATRAIVVRNGEVRQVPSCAWPGGACPVGHFEIARLLTRRGLVRTGRVGRAKARLVRGADFWDVYSEHLLEVCPRCSIRPRKPRKRE